MAEETAAKPHRVRDGLLVAILLWLVSPGALVGGVLAAAHWIFDAQDAVLIIVGFALVAAGVGAAAWRLRVRQERFEENLLLRVRSILVAQEVEQQHALPGEIEKVVRQVLVENERSAKQLTELARHAVQRRARQSDEPSS